jgi:hypothetical protein
VEPRQTSSEWVGAWWLGEEINRPAYIGLFGTVSRRRLFGVVIDKLGFFLMVMLMVVFCFCTSFNLHLIKCTGMTRD